MQKSHVHERRKKTGRSGRDDRRWVRNSVVGTIFENLEDGMSIEEIMEQFDVTREQVKAVLDFAARSLETPVRR